MGLGGLISYGTAMPTNILISLIFFAGDSMILGLPPKGAASYPCPDKRSLEAGVGGGWVTR
jgi:hypothetical protein